MLIGEILTVHQGSSSLVYGPAISPCFTQLPKASLSKCPCSYALA